jgi:hypothetical protein
MTTGSSARLAMAALLVGTLACAGSMAREEDQAGAAPQDTTEAQNPPGYRGMEQDTTQIPTDSQPTPTDTFLQQQGTGVPADTAGYSGLEHPDTSAAATDTAAAGVTDTAAVPGVDTSGMSGMSDTTSQMGADTTAQP